MNTARTSFRDLPSSEEAAAWGYRMILGREPENAEVVRDHVQHSASMADLRERFLQSTEFTQRYRSVERELGRNVSVFPPCSIQIDVDEATGAKLLAHVAQSWEHQGETEPYWSVMSEPHYVMEKIDETLEAFIDSGRENVERLMATLRRNGIVADPQWEALELGCGLGRSTRWLAPSFRNVTAVDISASHLQLAQQINKDAPGFDHIRWLHLSTPDAIAELPEFDLFFSMIVLQHNPPPVIAMVLDKIASKLRVGGIAFFQVPTYQRDYSYNVASYLRLRADSLDIEMHAFPQERIFRIFREHGCVPLEVFEDGLSGHRDNHRSNSFLFRKLLHDEKTGDSSSATLRLRIDDLLTDLDDAKRAAQIEGEKIRKECEAECTAALADAARYAAAIEADRAACEAQIRRIMGRFGWMRFLLPRRSGASR